jgi:hypothetical protein
MRALKFALMLGRATILAALIVATPAAAQQSQGEPSGSQAGADQTYLANKEKLISFACDGARVDEVKRAGAKEMPAGSYQGVDFFKAGVSDREFIFAHDAGDKFFVILATFDPSNVLPILGEVGRATAASTRRSFGPPSSKDKNKTEFAGETSTFDVFEAGGRIIRVRISCGSSVF